MKLLVKGIKIKRDNDNNNDEVDDEEEEEEDIDMNENENINNISSYPLKTRLEKIDSMLQSRTNSIIQFLEFIQSQINDSNEMNLRSYIENISKQMNECWKLTRSMTNKYGKDAIIHKQQLLLQENWTLSVNYKSVHRHYQYVLKYPNRVNRDDIDIKNIDIDKDSNNNNNNNNNDSNGYIYYNEFMNMDVNSVKINEFSETDIINDDIKRDNILYKINL